nr:hypothetical protein CFP56_66016 [Quercus suber]
MNHDLWNIVETTTEPTTPAWSKKNALALYLIRESCGSDRFSLIEKISKAEDAWEEIEFNSDQQLWDIVEGTDEPPKAENDEAWSHKNAEAYEVIKCWSKNEFYEAICKTSSAKIAWDTLEAICKLPKTAFEFLAEDDGSNYLDWSLKVKAILTNRQLWDIMEGTDDPPKAENDADAFKAWSHENDKALGLIWISSAKIAWDTLAAICALPKIILFAIATGFDFLADDGNNYLDWSLQVKAILMDRQLWDIVEGTDNPPKAEKNDMALGLIEYSCFWFRAKIDDKLRRFTSAKIVWDALAVICALPKISEEYDYMAWSVRMEAYLRQQNLWDIDEAATEPEDDEIAFNDRSKKNAIALYLIWESSDAFFSFKKSTRTAQIAWNTLAEFGKSGGSTALHIAILAGHLNIVKGLVNVLPTDKLKIKDKDGNTVLGYCALVGNTEMAKCIFDKCPSLLGIGNGPNGLIPVVMALTHDSNSNAVARCLFFATDLKYLSPGKSVNGATFVTRCIYSKDFDMALDALKIFPNLVTALDIENESPVLALASMSFAYTSGNQHIFWKRWIYNWERRYETSSGGGDERVMAAAERCGQVKGRERRGEAEGEELGRDSGEVREVAARWSRELSEEERAEDESEEERD